MVATTSPSKTNGSSAPSDERKTFTVTSPATGEPLRDLPIHSREQVFAEMARVRAAAPRWAALPIEERCARVAKVSDVISRRMDEIARVVSSENGKVHVEALLHDIGPTLLVTSYFAARAPKILAPRKIELAFARHRASYVSFQPKGVIGVITPWNFPFFMPGSDVAMSLIAGSGVLLKPSEVTPLSALILKECYDEAGIDPDLFRVVTGLGATGAALIDAGPDHVVFTGSVPTGRKVGVACAERMISYTLELGGKAPALVLEDADLDRAANAILWGGFANAGQVCASVERVYAAAPIYDQLVDRLTEKAAQLRVGPPDVADSDLGAMTWPKQLEIVESIVADARRKGARVTTGGERVGDRGLYYRPTVIADCTHEMDVMKAEIFGPVVPLMKVASTEEAVRLANDSHLGLGAYVFTRDEERGKRVAEQLQVGSVMINDVISHAGMPEMPWGGVKQSGLGVVRSERGLEELTNQLHVNYDRVPSLKRDPYWFPYSAKQTDVVKKALKTMFGDGVGAKMLRALLK
ncbi:aldehyde dehydrogenase family protein [Myxococcota bacterium]|nr:aldehyde dehydrogenase family protein [Myxococcota bacterium]